MTLQNGESSFRDLVRHYKKNAERRSLVFDLTDNELRILFQSNCHYCRTKPQQIHLPRKFPIPFIYNGIDRIDNAFGYSSDNVVPCCPSCNTSKGSKTIDEFLEFRKQKERSRA